MTFSYFIEFNCCRKFISTFLVISILLLGTPFPVVSDGYASLDAEEIPSLYFNMSSVSLSSESGEWSQATLGYTDLALLLM